MMHDEHGNEIQDGTTHPARLVAWEWDTTSDGDMYLAVIARIADGPFAGMDLRGRLYFQTDRADKNGRTAADRSMETLRAAGLQGTLETVDATTGALDAGVLSVVVERKVGNDGNTYVNAKYLNPPRGASIKTFAPPTPDAKRAFFAQMKQREAAAGRAVAQPPTQPRPVTKAPSSTPTREDDIPF